MNNLFTRTCTDCKAELPVGRFYFNTYRCKPCHKARAKADQQRRREAKYASARNGDPDVTKESSGFLEPVIRWSEEAIERESLKRLREQEIAESLKVEKARVEPDPFPKDPFVTRKVLERRWSCW